MPYTGAVGRHGFFRKVRGMKTLLRAAGAALIFAIASGPLQAQEPPKRIRGTIERVDGNIFEVKTREGNDIKVLLKENAPVLAVVRASLSDIKPGTYIGVSGKPQPDGSQKATEIHIFPEALRGVGDGHRPWDLEPESTMTNGNIEEQVTSADGQTLTLKYKDGEKKITLPQQTDIVAFQKAEAGDLKAGEKIFVSAAI